MKHRARPNVFLVYMPRGNAEAMIHYRETIEQRVSFDRVAPYVSAEVRARLKNIFGNRPITVWGSRNSEANRNKYEKMEEGDHLLIVEADTIRFMGKIALKTVNSDLSRELWKNINPRRTDGWDLIYFIANPVEIGVPFRELCKLFGWSETFQLRGFTTVSDDRLNAFYDRYDDLYSILMRIKAGQPVVQRHSAKESLEPEYVSIEPDDIDEVLRSEIVSDHVKMQWKLARLGLKAGEKVWVPVADQNKLRQVYAFNEFESEFAAGIDLPKSYVENIDVVWKEEYRIGAAFEIENSTAIYSGLLRFADLNIIAPNTIYPMFIVGPGERRNQVRQQLHRPVFRRLQLHEKVQFLPYETVEDLDKFFSDSAAGLSVDLIKARAEWLL